jgi:transcriptional regulator with XRE-family HTH domain
MSETLGELVKRLRRQANLSQKALAKKCDLSVSLIIKLERDGRNKKAWNAIRSSTLGLLADGLGLSKDSPDRQLLIDAASEQKRQRQLARAREVVSLHLGSGEILDTTQRTYVEPHDRTPEVRSTDITDRSSRAPQPRGTHDSGILLEILRRSRENYPIRTKLHGTKINWGGYHRQYPTVQEKISNDTWYAISDTGSFFGFMGAMIKYEYVNPDVLFDIVYIDKELWYDNKDFTDHMRREYNEHLWEEWEYLITLADKRDNKD